MDKIEKQFLYIICKDEKLHIKQDGLNYLNLKPILWNREGLYSIVPLAMIKNICDVKKANGCIIVTELSWHDTFKIDSNTAKLFLGENENDQCSYSTKSRT